MSCQFIGRNKKKCPNPSMDGFDYCAIKSHSPPQYYEDMIMHFLNLFENDRIKINTKKIEEVEADGACLFRSLSRGLFYKFNNDLDILYSKFEETGYLENKDFLKEFLEISECFKTTDFTLDTDLEEEIARELQSIIFNFIQKNHNINITKILNKNANDTEKIILSDLIHICHEINIDEYLDSYNRFAGDEDFIFDEGEKKKKILIKDRWGGIPEIAVFSILFNMGVRVYMPQKFNNKNFKAITITKISKDTFIYLKNVDNINIQSNNIKLLLRQYEDCSHYDYIKK